MFTRSVSTIAFTLLLVPAALRAADPIDPAKYDKLNQAIKPTAAENQWAAIPWTVDLWQARQRAAAQGKPILLWSMNGNPLACG